MNNKYLAIGQKLVPGIYGGMGPAAHIKFENHILSICKELGATGDQLTPIWLTVSGSSTPDRTKSIKGNGQNSLKHMIFFSKTLERMGADFIIATCNTAHFYLPKVAKTINVPIVSMIDQTVREIVQRYHGIKKVGLLATTGTLEVGLYQKALSEFGIEVLTFSTDSFAQKAVMNAIYSKNYGIKETGDKVSSRAKEILYKSAGSLTKNGAELVIAGCTEISLAFEENTDFIVVDPLKALARKVVALSLGYESLDRSGVLSSFAFYPPD